MTSFRYGDLPNKVDLQMIRDKIVYTEYIHRGTLTICIIQMNNGFQAVGESACVDPSIYSKALGEQYSFARAIDKLFALEGYLLATKRRDYVTNLTKTKHSDHYYDTDRNQPLEPVHDYNL